MQNVFRNTRFIQGRILFKKNIVDLAMKNLLGSILICLSLAGYAQEKSDSLEIKSGQPVASDKNIRICVPSRANAIKSPPLCVIKYGKKEDKYIANFPLNLIQPNEITSLEILKDSLALAKYGEEAKNGVIMITMTKESANAFKKRLKKYKTEQRTTDSSVVREPH